MLTYRMAKYDDSTDIRRKSVIEKAIIKQLEVAIPASLPVDFIVRGVLCACVQFDTDFEDAEIISVLNKLCFDKVIVKFSEAGLCDRYKFAADINYGVINHGIEE